MSALDTNKGSAVPGGERKLAALLHLSTFILPTGLPFALYLRSRPSDFLKHHVRQVLYLQLGWLALLAIHGLLHWAVSGVEALQEWASTVSGQPVEPWTVTAIGMVAGFNWLVIALESLAALALALWGGHHAWRGAKRSYFFTRTKPRPIPRNEGNAA